MAADLGSHPRRSAQPANWPPRRYSTSMPSRPIPHTVRFCALRGPSPRGILSEAEVTELAELWARALGALSEYVEEHSERELTPTDLDLVTADQQSIEQLERRFPDLTDIWSLSPSAVGDALPRPVRRNRNRPVHGATDPRARGSGGGARACAAPRRPWLIVIRACARDLSPHREGGHCR